MRDWCDAARDVEEDYGTEKAMGYLIGEKFLNFHSASSSASLCARLMSSHNRYRQEDNPDRYQQAAWAIVRQRYGNAFQYRFAVCQAETARRLAPDQGKYLT